MDEREVLPLQDGDAVSRTELLEIPHDDHEPFEVNLRVPSPCTCSLPVRIREPSTGNGARDGRDALP